jgi:F420-0:gamma-glutamyl ligase
MGKIKLYGLKISEEITSSTNISEFIAREAEKQGCGIKENDVIVITSKIVSKAEGKILQVK